MLADYFDGDVVSVIDKLKSRGMKVEIISGKLGFINAKDKQQLEVDHTFLTASSVLFDAIYVAGGSSTDEKFIKDATKYLEDAFMHYKPIGAINEGYIWLHEKNMSNGLGVVTEENKDEFVEKFAEAISAHRHWDREIY